MKCPLCRGDKPFNNLSRSTKSSFICAEYHKFRLEINLGRVTLVDDKGKEYLVSSEDYGKYVSDHLPVTMLL